MLLDFVSANESKKLQPKRPQFLPKYIVFAEKDLQEIDSQKNKNKLRFVRFFKALYFSKIFRNWPYHFQVLIHSSKSFWFSQSWHPQNSEQLVPVSTQLHLFFLKNIYIKSSAIHSQVQHLFHQSTWLVSKIRHFFLIHILVIWAQEEFQWSNFSTWLQHSAPSLCWFQELRL